MIDDNGVKILTDPFLTNNPKATVNPMDLKPDMILLTHDHGDHIGDVIDIAKHSGATVITVFDLAQELNKYGVNTIGGNKGGTAEFKNRKFTFVNADHSGVKAPPIGFILYLTNHIVYFAGDTNVFGDMKIIKDLYKPDIAMLPIDGFFNMGPRETVYALRLLETPKVIPMHYGTFPLLKGTPEQLKEEIDKEQLSTEMIEFQINEEKEI